MNRSSSFGSESSHVSSVNSFERKDFKVAWKPSALKLLSSLIKNESGMFAATVILFIEFLQLLAFCFQTEGWGPYAETFGVIIRWTQIEFAIVELNIVGLNIAIFAIAAVFISSMFAITFYCLLAFAKNNFFLGVWPLQTLRILVGNLCGVLFLPIISPLVGGLYCKIASIGKDCSSSGGQAILAISVILSILTIPYTLSISLTYFNPNTKETTYIGRQNANLELFEITSKFILIFVFVFAQSSIAFPVIQIFCHAAIATYIFLRLPYFNAKINIFRFSTFVILTWSSIMALVVNALKEDTTDIPFYIWIAILPIFTTAGAFIIYRRVDFMTNVIHRKVLFRLAVSEINDNEEKNNRFDPILVESIFQAIEGVRFSSPTMAEVHTRFLQKDSSHLNITIANCILTKASEAFPNNPAMHTIMGVFQGIWVKNIMGWQQELDNIRESKLTFLDEFSLYQQQGELHALKESMIAGENMDVVAALELNHILKSIKKMERMAVKRIKLMWKLLSSGKARMRDIVNVVQTVDSIQVEGQKTLNKFRKKYPEDHRILMAAARFENYVNYNYKKADEFAAKSIKRTQANQEDGSVILARRSSDVQKSSNFSSKQASNMSLQGVKSIFGRGRKETNAQHLYRQSIYNYRPSISKRNVLILVFVLAPLAMISLVEGILIASLIANITSLMKKVRISTDRRIFAINFADQARDMQNTILGGPANDGLVNLGPNDYELFAEHTTSMAALVNEFEANTLYLLHSDFPGSLTYDLWKNAQGSGFEHIIIYDPITGNRRKEPQSMLDASTLFINAAKEYVKFSAESFIDGSVETNANYRLVADQLANDGSEGFHVPSTLYIAQSNADIQFVLNALIYTCGCVCGLLLFFGLFVFRPLLLNMVRQVTDYQKKVMEIIIAIPRHDCSAILAKLNAVQMENDVHSDDIDDDEEDYGGGEYGKGDSGIGSSSQAGSHMMTRLTIKYSFGLLIIAAAFGITLALNYTEALAMKKFGNSLEKVSILQALTYKLPYYMREIIDPGTNMAIDIEGVDNNDITDETVRAQYYRESCFGILEADVESYFNLKYAIFFGDPESDIPYGNLDTVLKTIDIELEIDDPDRARTKILSGTYSAELLMQMLVEDVESVVASPDVNLTTSSFNYNRVRSVRNGILDKLAMLSEKIVSRLDHSQSEWLGIDLGMMMLIIFVIMGSYWFVFKKITLSLQKELDQSTMLLQFVPIEYGIQHYKLQCFLRGEDNAKLLFEERGWKIPDKDENKKKHESRKKILEKLKQQEEAKPLIVVEEVATLKAPSKDLKKESSEPLPGKIVKKTQFLDVPQRIVIKSAEMLQQEYDDKEAEDTGEDPTSGQEGEEEESEESEESEEEEDIKPIPHIQIDLPMTEAHRDDSSASSDLHGILKSNSSVSEEKKKLSYKPTLEKLDSNLDSVEMGEGKKLSAKKRAPLMLNK